MLLFGRLFRRRKAPSPGQARRAIERFANARSWNECKRVVEEHRTELLTDEADQLFAELLDQYQGDKDAVRVLADRRTLLARCRRDGIEAAFTGRLGPVERDPADATASNELIALLSQIQSLTRPGEMSRRVEACQAALRLLEREGERPLQAALHSELARSLTLSPLGPQAENLERAIAHYERSLEVYTPDTFPQHCRDSAYWLGRLLYERGRLADARRALSVAHDAVEALRGDVQRVAAKQALSNENADLYARLVFCCLAEGDTAAAFQYAAAGKGRAFVDMLASARVELSGAGADDPGRSGRGSRRC